MWYNIIIEMRNTTIETQLLNERISKAEAKLLKCQNLISKLSKVLDPDLVAFAKTATRRDIDELDNKRNLPFETRCKVFQLRDNFIKEKELQDLITKYQNQLTIQTNYDNEEKIPAIVEFLKNWRTKAYEYYIQMIKQLKEELKSLWGLPYEERQIRGNKLSEIYSGNIFAYTRYSEKDMLIKLNKDLDNEVTRKYKSLVYRIREKAGIILDATGLYIASNLEINGLVIGDKNKVYVETITAGGYNIQILHYRVLVKEAR